MNFKRKLPDWWQTALGVGTLISATDIMLRWGAGGFGQIGLSRGALASTVLNLALVALATAGVTAAVHQWRKRRESDQFILDLAARLPKPPEEPPLVPNVTDYGTSPLNTGQIATIFREAKKRAERTYEDAAPYAIAILGAIEQVPSIRVRIEFWSPHADRGVSYHWDNYVGLCAGHAGQTTSEDHVAWSGLPWETDPAWERGYRLSFEKAQPVSSRTTVIIAAKVKNALLVPARPSLWCYGFGADFTFALVDNTGEVERCGSVYIAKLNVLEVIPNLTRTCAARSGRSDANDFGDGGIPPPKAITGEQAQARVLKRLGHPSD